MRKILLVIIIFVLICFFMPILFTKNPETTIAVDEKEKEENKNKEEYVYKNYGTVKLLHTATGEIETLSMDEYLYRSSIC